jgi:hypothetical protein
MKTHPWCGRCKAKSKRTGRRCKLRTCVSKPYCHVHLPAIKGVKVTKSKLPGAGKGLFAARDFKRAEAIAEYTGKKLTDEQFDRKYGRDGQGDYSLYLGGGITLDSDRPDYGLARYANMCFIKYPPGCKKGKCKKKGKRTCVNNARFHYSRRYDRVLLRACTPIARGQEVYASYGPDYLIGGQPVEPETSKCRS